jgi:hypothetical protein
MNPVPGIRPAQRAGSSGEWPVALQFGRIIVLSPLLPDIKDDGSGVVS